MSAGFTELEIALGVPAILKRVERYAYRMWLGDVSVVEDAVSEARIALWELSLSNPDLTNTSLLFTIAKRAARAWISKEANARIVRYIATRVPRGTARKKSDSRRRVRDSISKYSTVTSKL